MSIPGRPTWELLCLCGCFHLNQLKLNEVQDLDLWANEIVFAGSVGAAAGFQVQVSNVYVITGITAAQHQEQEVKGITGIMALGLMSC